MRPAHRLFGIEARVLLVVLLVVLGVWAFIEIADEVAEGQTQSFDERTITRLRRADDPGVPIGPGWLRTAALDITAMGGESVLTLAVAVVAGYLILDRRRHALWLVLIATGGGWALSLLLKQAFARPRPSVVPHLVEVGTSSFPSGHAMMSAVVYLTLGALLTRIVPGRHAKVYALAVSMVLTLLIGSTRVYLGVHYPSDVLAGWTAGLVWALLCWLLARYLQSRGAVEQPAESQT